MIISKLYKITDTFTRPADTTAYTIGDLVANSTTAGSVVPLKFNIGPGGFRIQGARVGKSDSTITLATFSLHLHESIPTLVNGDNGALSTNRANKAGILAFPIMVAFSTQGQANLNLGDTGFLSNLAGYTSTGILYGLLSAQAAYTPVSAEVFDVTLIIEKH